MQKNLFFGQYLINRGLVTEEQMVHALEEQRLRTSAFEKMALRLSLLNMKEVFQILTQQAATDLSFPEAAVRGGLLTAEQVVFVLENIDRERPSIGELLVEQGAVERHDMVAELERFEEHKRHYAAIADLLAGVDFFKRVEPGALRALAYITEKCQFAAGERVVSEGERADCFYCVASGYLRITKDNPHGGGEEIYLGNLGPNDIFGESSIFEQASRNANVIAEDEVLLLKIGRREFLHFLKEHPASSQSLLINIIQRLLEKLSFANKELAYERQHFLPQEEVESLISEFFD